MYRVTTPTHTFTLPIETSTCKEILVTYEQGNETLEFHYEDNTLPDGMTLVNKDVMIRLTQEQTKAFSAKKPIVVQIRVLTSDDEAFASQIFKVFVNDVLNDEVLADE